MVAHEKLSGFIALAQRDPRMGLSHIGLFATLLSLSGSPHDKACLEMFGKQIMALAKISSSATYHRLLNDLNRCGYIKYEPSFSKRRASRIYISDLSMTNENRTYHSARPTNASGANCK